MLQQFVTSPPSPAAGRRILMPAKAKSFPYPALLALPLILLTACGGGGGGGGSITAKEQPEPCFNTATGECLTNAQLGAEARRLAETVRGRYTSEVNRVWGHSPGMTNALIWTAEAINAHQAAAHLALAHGDAYLDEEVTIGFIDDGILASHETFDYVDVTEKLLLGAVDQGLDEFSHGTAVASIAVGNFLGPLDSPPDINVRMFGIPLGSGDGSYTPITLNRLSAADFTNSALYSYVLNHHLDILNLSFGYSGSIEGYTEQDLRNNYSKTITTLPQAGIQEKTILVWAAGNAGGRTTIDGESAKEPLENLALFQGRV